jgi:predicted transposase YdaD
VLEEKKLIHKVEDSQERSDLLALAAMVAFRKFKNGLIKELFYEEYQMMKASNFIEEWIQEGWEKGRREGLEKGREEGRQVGRQEGWQEGQQEGRREGQIKVILSQLKKILGRVRPDLERKIHLLTDKEIEKLTCDLLDMRAISDLETWVKQRTQSN